MANGARAYGGFARTLHWVTVLALLAQFVVGYLLDVDDGGAGAAAGAGTVPVGAAAAAVTTTRRSTWA